MLVHKYNFLLQLLLKLVHTSHDFIATKLVVVVNF